MPQLSQSSDIWLELSSISEWRHQILTLEMWTWVTKHISVTVVTQPSYHNLECDCDQILFFKQIKVTEEEGPASCFYNWLTKHRESAEGWMLLNIMVRSGQFVANLIYILL